MFEEESDDTWMLPEQSDESVIAFILSIFHFIDVINFGVIICHSLSGFSLQAFLKQMEKFCLCS